MNHFAPVVGPADGAEAQRDQQHNPHETVAQVGPQQCGNGNRQQHQHAAHGGRAALAQVRLHGVLADRLADLQRHQAPDHERPGDQTDQQGRQRCHHGPEGQVLEHPEKTEFRRQGLQPLGQVDQHAFSFGADDNGCDAAAACCCMSSSTRSIFMKRDPLTSALAQPGRCCLTSCRSALKSA